MNEHSDPKAESDLESRRESGREWESRFDDPVAVRSYSEPLLAHLACSALEAHGIQARVADDQIVSMAWPLSNAVGGVKVMVRREDVATAEALLDHIGQDPDASQPADDDDVCPRCGSRSVTRVTVGKDLGVWTWLLVGLPLTLIRRRLRCAACGHTFKPPASPARSVR